MPRIFWFHLYLVCGGLLAVATIVRGGKWLGWAGLASFTCAGLIILLFDELWSLHRWLPVNEQTLQVLYFGFLFLGGILTVLGFLLTFVHRPTRT